MIHFAAAASLHIDDVRQRRRPVEIGLGRAIETETGEPALVRQRLDPVLLWLTPRASMRVKNCQADDIVPDGVVHT